MWAVFKTSCLRHISVQFCMMCPSLSSSSWFFTVSHQENAVISWMAWLCAHCSESSSCPTVNAAQTAAMFSKWEGGALRFRQRRAKRLKLSPRVNSVHNWKSDFLWYTTMSTIYYSFIIIYSSSYYFYYSFIIHPSLYVLSPAAVYLTDCGGWWSTL